MRPLCVTVGVLLLTPLLGMAQVHRIVAAPDHDFVIGVGQADLNKGRLVCQRMAELAARADLARQVRVQVLEQIHDRIRERTGREPEQEIEIVREERVSELLQEVRITDRTIDESAGLCTARAIMRKPPS